MTCHNCKQQRRSRWILKFTTNFLLCVSLPVSAKVWVISWQEAEFSVNRLNYPNKGTMQLHSSPRDTELKDQHSCILSSQFIVSSLDFHHFILFNHVTSFPCAMWCAKLKMEKPAYFSERDTQYSWYTIIFRWWPYLIWHIPKEDIRHSSCTLIFRLQSLIFFFF